VHTLPQAVTVVYSVCTLYKSTNGIDPIVFRICALISSSLKVFRKILSGNLVLLVERIQASQGLLLTIKRNVTQLYVLVQHNVTQSFLHPDIKIGNKVGWVEGKGNEKV